jgi:hypothetical protein
MRHMAIPTAEGVLITPDVATARADLEAADFFTSVFDESRQDQRALHQQVLAKLLTEALAWHDEPLAERGAKAGKGRLHQQPRASAPRGQQSPASRRAASASRGSPYPPCCLRATGRAGNPALASSLLLLIP